MFPRAGGTRAGAEGVPTREFLGGFSCAIGVAGSAPECQRNDRADGQGECAVRRGRVVVMGRVVVRRGGWW